MDMAPLKNDQETERYSELETRNIPIMVNKVEDEDRLEESEQNLAQRMATENYMKAEDASQDNDDSLDVSENKGLTVAAQTHLLLLPPSGEQKSAAEQKAAEDDEIIVRDKDAESGAMFSPGTGSRKVSLKSSMVSG